MNIIIYGAGAVGLGLGSFLLPSKQSLTIIARKNTTAALQKNGLKRTGIFGGFTAKPKDFRCFSKLADVPPQIFDFILVTVKSFDSRTAAQDIASHASLWDANTKIILIQNGWGNAEQFTEHFPVEQVFSARIITGFTRPKPNEVHITVHADAMHIGSLFDQDLKSIETLALAIGQGGFPCIPFNEIAKDLWAKMLYNCALNPLGAILNVSYGQLAANEDTRTTMDAIIEEIYAVMDKCGYATHWESPEDYKRVFYEKLVPATAEHKSSTLQSLKSGKKTEIEALTGMIITLAGQHNVDVPTNRSVYDKIKFLE